MINYPFSDADFSLAGLRTGEPLTAADRDRLQLRLATTEVALGADEGPEILEQWDNDLGLEVAVVNGLISLVAADCVTLDGCTLASSAENDLIARFGSPVRREQVTDELSMLVWGAESLVAFFCMGEFQGLYISEPD